VRLLAFPWPSFFVSFAMVPTIDLLLDFCFSLKIYVKQDVEIEGWKSIILTHLCKVMLEE
jgi:hypothetical protein